MPNKKTPEVTVKFNPGDFVFAKLKGYSAWPARIDSSTTDRTMTKYNVFFFGSHNHASLNPKYIFPYEKFKDQFVKANSSVDFIKGISELEYAQIHDSNVIDIPNKQKNEGDSSKRSIESAKSQSFVPEKYSSRKRNKNTIKENSGSPKKKKYEKLNENSPVNNNTISAMKKKLDSEKSLENISKIPKLSETRKSNEKYSLDQLNQDIKNSLNISEPNVTKCVESLKRAIATKIDAKLLSSSPQIISTVKKVRKYKASETVRQLADELLIKLKDVCRSLPPAEFNGIFQTAQKLSVKPELSVVTEGGMITVEPAGTKNDEISPKVSENIKNQREEDDRIADTIAQIQRELTVNLPKEIIPAAIIDSHAKQTDQRTCGEDEYSVYTDIVNDEDIHNMLGV